jgi:hypothetical protein
MPHRIRVRPIPWNIVILLCSKCTRKIDGGYGTKRKQAPKDVRRAELKANGRRRQVRIIETRCIGFCWICPKKAVTALNASRPECILTVPTGTPTGEALALLLSCEPRDAP